MHCPKCDNRLEHCLEIDAAEHTSVSGWYCEVCDELIPDSPPNEVRT